MAEKICKALEDLSINYTLHEHDHFVTVKEQRKGLSHLPGNLTKNLFLKDTKKNKYYLVTLNSTQNLDLKILGKKLSLGSVNLRFATEEVLFEKLQITKGSVSPFGIINDIKNEITVVLDEELLKDPKKYIICNPLECDKTISILPDNLLKFLKNFEHEPLLVCGNELTLASPVNASKSTDTSKSLQITNPDSTKSKEGLSVTKEENFAEWYSEVITKSSLIDYYDVSGCYILRPWAYKIWEEVQKFMDSNFKSLGVSNCYFPMFVSKDKLMREKEHVEGFAPEVAWITKYGDSDLKEPVAIRPTSETIMYPAFKNWIRSHRDLPLKLNQWNNVVRWEFKNPTPFIRTREFLWQEGHTAYHSKTDADKEVLDILRIYRRTYEELLAVPMIEGKKTENEKFAGADYTTTIEGFIPSTGRGIQAATSHHLGQNFGKMFGIQYEDEKGKLCIPYQNSWGFTTRSIGIMIMVHGDNKGLVLPPPVAPIQCIVIPVPFKDKGNSETLFSKSKEVVDLLIKNGIRADLDERTIYTPGWKYNYWELRGVPLRIEIGPKDLEKNQTRIVRRDNGEKSDIGINDQFCERIKTLLMKIQDDMLARSTAERDKHIKMVMKWEEFVPTLQTKCMVLTPFCNETEWEEKVKELSRQESFSALGIEGEAENAATSVAAKTLCIPFKENEQPLAPGTKCFISGKEAKCWVLWGRSY